MGAPKGRADSREKAKGLFCSMHPFRHAYAICAYCHKLFCFEDIIEFQKDYYCMEDIGSIESKHVQKLSFEYSTSSFVTSSIMLAAFVLFFYYTHAQLVYTFNFVLSNPLGFVTNLGSNFAYLISIVTLGTMILAFGAALYILLGSRGGHMLASMLSIAAVVLLTYQYLGTLRSISRSSLCWSSRHSCPRCTRLPRERWSTTRSRREDRSSRSPTDTERPIEGLSGQPFRYRFELAPYFFAFQQGDSPQVAELVE